SCASRLEKEGFNVIYLPVDNNGVVSVESLYNALSDDVFLVSIMSANNETGVIQDIPALSKAAHEIGALFHTDAVQGIYDIRYNLAESDIDMLSLSAHKLHGLKGCGALYIKQGVLLPSLIYGGAQEQGRRAGTENLPGIFSLGCACRIIMRDRDAIIAKKQQLTKLFEAEISSQIKDITINSASVRRAAGISNISFHGVDGEALMLNLDLRGVCASTGSACLSGSVDPSHVLMAMGIEKTTAIGSVRFSFSDDNTQEETLIAVDIIRDTVNKLRNMHH
ncbi:MAG: cysteine desulfurase, partial [Clostridia bacterium]|nr:cysteine desulfurase [Clostridia bacterium]